MKYIYLLFILSFSSTLYSQTIITNSSDEVIPIKRPSDNKVVPFAIIEKVPIYPGCKGEDNLSLKKCMSIKINEFIGKKFNIDRATDSLNLPSGTQRIIVNFTIAKTGYITNVQAKANYLELEKEAIRVISLLPKMQPGTQRGEKVNVLYSLPIAFKIVE